MIIQSKKAVSLLAAVCIATMALSATVAFAALPPGVETLASYDFEPAGHTFPYIAQLGNTPADPTKAYWGPITQEHHDGSHALWCAGAAFPGGGASNFFGQGKYPEFTRGRAHVELPELANYYRADVSFYYKMPSKGQNDEFQFTWNLSGQYGVPSKETRLRLPETATWTPVTKNLWTDGTPLKLSRQGADVGIEFIDIYDNGTETQNGIGASVDDFTITGSKYGPVRGLTASSDAGGQVLLNWDVPVRAFGSSTPEERSITYRLWRSPVNQESWEELTSDVSRLSGASYAYSPPAGSSYDYAVQAWDLGTGAGHGETVRTSWPPKAVLTKPFITPGTNLIVNVPFDVSGAISPAFPGGTPVQVQISQDASTPTGSFLATLDASGSTYSSSIAIAAQGTWYVRARHTAVGYAESFSDWQQIEVSLPLASLGNPSKPAGAVRMWSTFTTSGSFQVHATTVPVVIEASRDKSAIVKRYPSTVAAGATKYSVPGIALLTPGTWYIRAAHEDSSHRYSTSAWTTVVVSPEGSVTAPRIKSHSKRTYSVYGTVKPRQTNTKYLKVYAYRLSHGTYRYVKLFSTKVTIAGQAAYTSKYTSSVKFTSAGKWKLRVKHLGHSGEWTRYSGYTKTITVK